MRRVLAASSNFADTGDVTTLANPEIVERVRHQVQSAKLEHGELPRTLTPEEIEEIKRFGSAE
jgi:acetyl-CoA synthetase